MNTVDMSRLENFVSNKKRLTHRPSASLHCIVVRLYNRATDFLLIFQPIALEICCQYCRTVLSSEIWNYIARSYESTERCPILKYLTYLNYFTIQNRKVHSQCKSSNITVFCALLFECYQAIATFHSNGLSRNNWASIHSIY